jgi:hypothetical protein
VKSDLVDLNVEIKHQTAQAVLIFDPEDDERTKTIWLPHSQIEIEYKDQHKRFATVTMPEWLAIEKGLV